MKILAVDDYKESRQMLVEIVSSMGHEVFQAADGESALVQAREISPDLIILDVNMPGISGFDVCRTLKKDPKTRSIPVIFLTGLHEDDDRIRGLDIGADDYLTKPYLVRELTARIDARLRAKAETDAQHAKEVAIRQTFERFLAPQVVERLLLHPEKVKLEGELQEVSVLFTDLEGFTTIAERTSPERILRVLNQYHELVATTVRKFHGNVISFIGDGVMALYNTPETLPRHAEAAVKTALAIKHSLDEFHRRFDEPFRLPVNFGIHTGQAIVGSVGTAFTQDFTAVGDTVNLAARLQGLAEHGQILISEQTRKELDDRIMVRTMGRLTVKNRTEAVLTYEVLGRVLSDDSTPSIYIPQPEGQV